ncbi:MAG: bi-domain-containing oxidoreductase [Magnetococcales bacterium]|nr:bi-domain-containing oxidoreductase [Magnetococcales bacterium]
MKQILVRQGKAMVEEVPAPQVTPGSVLVRVDHSCISIGTEMSGVRSSGDPLWKKALRHPNQVRKVLQMAARDGIGQTRRVVQGKLAAAGNPTGYSLAGVVVEVGEGIDDISVGDRVACAGAQCANHADYVCVPRNLTVLVPDGLGLDNASTVTLGAIALQGVRRASPTLGESFVVIGLGILGQLTVQLLKANGCHVIGTDLNRDRIQTALDNGLDIGLHPEDGNDIASVARLTDGIGADGVIITAAAATDAIVSTAFSMCRKKGRVVLVGDVGLGLNRADFYAKELDFFISCSYGPGRYDRPYEEEGLDYPVSYVRWTENRNMSAYLRLLADGKLNVSALIDSRYPIEQATDAYAALAEQGDAPLMVLLRYEQTEDPNHVVANPLASSAASDRIRIAIVGAGGFAKGMHIPNLQSMGEDYHIQAIASRTGHNAQTTAKQCAANYATTDYAKIVSDADVDAVLLCTRHDLHADMALQALQAGKHVLVEKPLALTAAELKQVTTFYQENGETPPVLLTGFNRRFSPHIQYIHKEIAQRSNPMIINYRMNAGHIPLDHWVHGKEGGGRNLGEACHIYDLFTYLTGSKVTQVTAHALDPKTGHYGRRDNFVATISFDDGSVATLTYTALGCGAYPKEHMELYVDGTVMVLEDYQKVSVYGRPNKGMKTTTMAKGQREEVEAFAQAIKQGGEWPIPLWQQVQATEIALSVDTSLN